MTLTASAQHLLARTARAAGNEAEARRHSDRAGQLLRQIQEQARGSNVLRRADLKAIADASAN